MSDPHKRFDESYWRSESAYRKFDDYRAALLATKTWYVGLIRLIESYLPTSGRHLDAGCGHGAVVHMLRERGFDCYGVDASEWIIEEARAFAPELADHFAVADLEDAIPFGGSFDLITCLEVVEHVERPELVLKVLANALAVGGTLILTTPNPVNRIPRNDPSVSDPTHISLHEPRWWSRAVEDAGLQVERELTFFPLPLLWRVSPVLARWIPLGPTAGPGYLLVARR